MMNEATKNRRPSYRPAVLIGGIVGLGLVVAWFSYDNLMTPARPSVATAGASEVIAYVSNPRGLDRLMDIEQQQFLQQWKDGLTQEARKKELKDALASLSDEDRKAFTEVIFKHLKKNFMDEASQYARIQSPAEKSEFCRARVAEASKQSAFLKEIAIIFKSDFGGPNEFQEWVLRHTTPGERQLGEPYVEALKRVSTQMKRESRATTTAQG
ncbi:MAG TPA: hypothetical protein VNT79_15660 [Phycisphaerae bacterium]|nr:hypothetical protein [Phycisphaerae bacterium]